MDTYIDIAGFPSYYISNKGDVKRVYNSIDNKEKILKKTISKQGYYQVTLYDANNKQQTKKVHQLVAITFLNHTPNHYNMIVHHKDMNRLNNHVDNLEIVTMRENSYHRNIKKTSKYVGVNWNKRIKKWSANIHINSKIKYLGSFINELDASNAYQEALNKLK